MRVAVMGAGGTGGFFGGVLARSGVEVFFVARGAHLEEIQRAGLTVRSSHLGDFTVKVQAAADARGQAPADVLLLCVKSYDLEEAAAACAPLVGPETVVLPVQNGIGTAERVAKLLGQEQTACAVAHIAAGVQRPGVIVHTGALNKLFLGEMTGERSGAAGR